MLYDISDVGIYIRSGVTDFRKSINGLAALTQEIMKKPPMSGSLYVFCNRHRNRLKVLYCTGTGTDFVCGTSDWRKRSSPGHEVRRMRVKSAARNSHGFFAG